MNDDQREICCLIMQKITRRPVHRMFLDVSPSCIKNKPLSLTIISDRLQSNKYPNADEWIYDMRQLFASEIHNPTNSLRAAAAKLLMEDFDQAMMTLSPTLSPHLLRFQITEGHLITFINSFHPAIDRKTQKHQNPTAEILNEAIPDNYTAQNLYSDIQILLNSPSLRLRVIAFIHHIRPSAVVFGQRLTLMLSLLDPEELLKAGKYVRQIMHDAATGKLDVFNHTPGFIPNNDN